MGNFPQHFPQDFLTRFSHKNFLQDFPELDPDWLAPHHPIPNAKFPPITAFLKLAFSPPPSPTNISRKNFPQEFPARFSHKIFLQEFPARFSHKHFSQTFSTTFSHKNFPQDFPTLDPDWLAPHHPIPNAKFPPITAFLKLAFSPPPCPTRISRKIFPQEFSTRFSHKNFPQEFPANISHKHFPTNISRKIFPQDFPELDPDWLAPHHPIPNAKFPPITSFLKLAFSPSTFSNKHFPQEFFARFSCKIFPQEFPARFSHKNFLQTFVRKHFLQHFPTRFLCKNFLQDFPTRISHKIFSQDFPTLDPDWLAPHHPIPNAKFPPITALLNRPTYHKRSKVSPPPFPQILREPQINE